MSTNSEIDTRVETIKAALLKLNDNKESQNERLFFALYTTIRKMEDEGHSIKSILSVMGENGLKISTHVYKKMKRKCEDARSKNSSPLLPATSPITPTGH